MEEGGFMEYMRSEGKLGGQNKPPRLANNRKLANSLTLQMTDNKKHIAILGSTGSIGTQALDVISANQELFEVEVLSANSNSSLLIEQALIFRPNAVVIVNEDKYQDVFDALSVHDIKVYAGKIRCLK